MQLDEYISDTLQGIVKGVEAANQGTKSERFKLAGLTHHQYGVQGEFVEYDVVLETVERKGKSGGGQVNIKVATLSGDLNSEKTDQKQHRIKFKVFVSENTQ